MQRSTTTTPDAYIASLSDDVRPDIEALDADIAAIMTGHERVLWEGAMWGGTQQAIIGYGSYQAVSSRGQAVDWFIVGLARQKSYLSLYVSAVEDGAYLVKSFGPRLGKVKVGSANVTFRHLADVDRDVLRELIARARDLSDRQGTAT